MPKAITNIANIICGFVIILMILIGLAIIALAICCIVQTFRESHTKKEIVVDCIISLITTFIGFIMVFYGIYPILCAVCGV